MQKQTHTRFERDTFVNETRRPGSGSAQRSHVTSIVKGQEYNVVIEGIGHNGDGFCHINEYTVFIPNTEVGEEVKIKLKKVRNTVAFADRLGDTQKKPKTAF